MYSKYSLNEDYFNEINTEEKAYWLGFIYADGYVCKRERKTGITYEFNLRLKPQDIGHLEKFKNALESTHPVFIVNSKHRDYSKLYISNKKFASCLYEKYGIEPHRHSIEKIKSHLNKKLIKHFIRGLIDGDGSFSTHITSNRGYLQRKWILTIGGSEELLNFCEDYLIECGVVENFERKICRRHKDRDGNWRTKNFCGEKQVKTLLKFFYEDASIYLDRKYQKHLEFLNIE